MAAKKTRGLYRRPRSPFWWMAYSVNGVVKRESTGTERLLEARAVLAKKQAEVFEGKHFPDKRKSGLTVDGLRDLYLGAFGHKRSAANDRQRFGVIVEHFGAGRSVETIQPSDVAKLRDWLLKRPTKRGTTTSSATVNRYLALLKAALRFAAREGHAVRVERGDVRMLREGGGRDRICTEDEFRRLSEAANPKLELAIRLAYFTGMRLGEIAGLQWQRIDFDRRIITLYAEGTKTGKGRRVPLVPEVVEALRAFPRRLDGFVLGTTSANLSPQFTRLAARLEIEDLRFHDLRHSAATNLRRAGADLAVIKDVLGHSTWAMVARYQTVDDDELVQAADRMAEHLNRKR
jgi:integrase